MLGTLLALCGVYSIYLNKEKYERPHLTSLHGKVGAALFLTSVGVGMVGAVFLHPDFGTYHSLFFFKPDSKHIDSFGFTLTWGFSLMIFLVILSI